MFSLLCHLATAFVGAVIPVFYSYKTLKKPTKTKLSQWSKYWSVFGAFLALDAVLDLVFISYIIPFYEFGKLLFIIWAVNPYTFGAQFVFDKILAPFIRRHERRMDKYLERMFDSFVDRSPDFMFTMDSIDNAIMQREDRVVIEEILTENNYHEESLPREVPAPPNFLEIESEESEANDDVVIIEPERRIGRNVSPLSSVSPIVPAPANHRRGRKPKSSEPRRRVSKSKKAADSNEDEYREFTVSDEAHNKPVRRSSRAAAITARKRLVSHEAYGRDEE